MNKTCESCKQPITEKRYLATTDNGKRIYFHTQCLNKITFVDEDYEYFNGKAA